MIGGANLSATRGDGQRWLRAGACPPIEKVETGRGRHQLKVCWADGEKRWPRRSGLAQKFWASWAKINGVL
jgi:hypothetical protein